MRVNETIGYGDHDTQPIDVHDTAVFAHPAMVAAAQPTVVLADGDPAAAANRTMVLIDPDRAATTHPTAVLHDPHAVVPEQRSTGTTWARRVLVSVGAATLFAGGVAAGAFAVSATTFTAEDLQRERSEAEQAGYTAGVQEGSDEASAQARDEIDRAYDRGYQQGYQRGAADAVPVPAPAPAAPAEPAAVPQP